MCVSCKKNILKRSSELDDHASSVKKDVKCRSCLIVSRSIRRTVSQSQHERNALENQGYAATHAS
jgi:hypothetical protein